VVLGSLTNQPTNKQANKQTNQQSNQLKLQKTLLLTTHPNWMLYILCLYCCTCLGSPFDGLFSHLNIMLQSSCGSQANDLLTLSFSTLWDIWMLSRGPTTQIA
jgi:hypothetical protein